MLLSSKSRTAPTHRDTKWKLRPTYYGPFSIAEVVRAEDGLPAAYRLRLPLHWKVHSVFPVSRLREYYPGLEWPGRDMGTPPESRWLEGGEEYVVHAILDHRWQRVPRSISVLRVLGPFVCASPPFSSLSSWLCPV